MGQNRKQPFDEMNLLLTAIPTLVNGRLTLTTTVGTIVIPASEVKQVENAAAAAAGSASVDTITLAGGPGTAGAVHVVSVQGLKRGQSMGSALPRTAKIYQPNPGQVLAAAYASLKQALINKLGDDAAVGGASPNITITNLGTAGDFDGSDLLVSLFTDDTALTFSNVHTAAVESVGQVSKLVELFPDSVSVAYLNANGAQDRIKLTRIIQRPEDGSIQKIVYTIYGETPFVRSGAGNLQDLFDVGSETDQTVITD